MNFIDWIIVNFRHIKILLSSFKILNFRTITNNKRIFKNDLVQSKGLLKELGFDDIRNFSIRTWKFYKYEHRFVLTAKMNTVKYFIKCNTNDTQLKNSIIISEVFGNKTDFIPHGNKILLGHFCCYQTDFIPSYSFFELKGYIKKYIEEYVDQSITILDIFYQYKVIHQDLDYSNILFRKKDLKMMVIDFDNSCSDMIGLTCKKVPYRNAIFHNDGSILVDDAYALYSILKSLFKKISAEEDERIFGKLKNLIGRNCRLYC